MRCLVIPILAAVALAGCGSSDKGSGSSTEEQSQGSQTFMATKDLPLSFSYPTGLRRGSLTTNQNLGGGRPVGTAGLGLDHDNVIGVSRYRLRKPANLDDPGFRRALDALVSKLSLRHRGAASGRRVRFGGVPGLQYRIRVAKPASARSRVTFLFDGTTEYEIDCQSTPALARSYCVPASKR
ncbi:MAG: hypothetical protein DLM61_24805 [Pseudonocardiales bacterium]|nr:MAG: hypothetical protein DLM61_24805 [Pseudonocardiales bacterium]